MSSRKRGAIALALFLTIFAIGTSGYVLIENYRFVEALYMTVITISTVGYGELKPLSEGGRIFTALLILISFGSMAFAAHAVGESLIENVWSSRSEIRKMKKRISHLNSHYIICGFGRVGAAAVEHFKRAAAEFVIIETSPKQNKEIGEMGYLAVEGDATRESILNGSRNKVR